MELNKNGESESDLYCWKCTGSHSEMRHADTGKGRMRETGRRKVRSRDKLVTFIQYRCMKCTAYSEYEEGEWKDYGIRQKRF